jgi:hypothetical protein
MKNDPPKIFFSQAPALLVNFDGEPIWSPIAKNDLKFAVNTNWDVFQHEPTKTFYLRYNQSWLTATAVTGPWTAVSGKLPPSFSSLPPDANFTEVRAAVPGKSLPSKDRPTVFASLEPAEMILLRGAPNYLLVQGAKDLLWVSNTDSDVFRLGDRRRVTWWRTWFSAPTSRPLDIRDANCRTSRRFRSSTSARACSRRCRARIRRSKPCCSRRSRKRRASIAPR